MLKTINLYPFEKTFDKTLTPQSGFVGFEITPYLRDYTIAKIDFIELLFDSEVTFNIYLFNSNLKTAIKSKEVTTSANESKIVALDDFFAADGTTHKGGNFYIGYFEEDLGTAKPIDRDYDNAVLKVENEFFEMQSFSC